MAIGGHFQAHFATCNAMPRRALAWSASESGQEERRKDPTRLEEALEQGRAREARSDGSERDVDVRPKRKERILQALEKVHEAQGELMMLRDVLQHVEQGDMLAVVPTERRAEERRGDSDEEAAMEEAELAKQMRQAALKLRRSASNMRRRVNRRNDFYEEMERLQRIWKLLKTTDGKLAFDTGYVSGCKHNRVFPVRRGPQGRVQVFDTGQGKAGSLGTPSLHSTECEGYEHVHEVLQMEQKRLFACMLQDELVAEYSEDPTRSLRDKLEGPRHEAPTDDSSVPLLACLDILIETEYIKLLRRRIRRDLGVREDTGADAVYPAVREPWEQNDTVASTLSTVEEVLHQLPPCKLHASRSSANKAAIELCWPNQTQLVINVNSCKVLLTGGRESKSWVANLQQLLGLKGAVWVLFAVQNLAALERDLLSMGHSCARSRFELTVFAHKHNLAVRIDMDELENGHLSWIVEDIENKEVRERVPGIQTEALILHFLFKRERFLVESTE